MYPILFNNCERIPLDVHEKSIDQCSNINTASRKGHNSIFDQVVAQDAGLAKSTTYHYFQSKAELFQGVVQDIVVMFWNDTQQTKLQTNQTLASFLHENLLPIMKGIETSGRTDVMLLVMTESKQFPQLAHIYEAQVYAHMLRFIRSNAKLALERGDHHAGIMVEQPELLMAPLWMGVIHNRILGHSPQISISRLFETQWKLIFHDATD